MTAMALSVFESFPLAWNVTEKRAIFTLPPDSFPLAWVRQVRKSPVSH